MKYSKPLTEGSISRALFHLALPILGANVLQSLNASVTAIWVGRYLGEAALAAVASAHLVMALLAGTALGVAAAATILVAQCIGTGNLNNARRVVSTGLIFFALISIALALSGSMLSKWLLLHMKMPADSLPLAVAYMKVLFLALPIVYLYMFVMSLLSGTGNSKTPFCFMVLSVLISCILNPILIFGLGPIPRNGITGAAIATLVAQALGLGALIAHLYWHRHPLCPSRSELATLQIDWSLVRLLVRKGVPMGAQVLVASLGGVLMIVLVNRFGVETTAAFGALLQLWIYVQMPAVALGVAVSTMAAQNAGAQKWDRVRSIGRVGIVYCVLLTGCIVLIVYALDAYAYRLFLPVDSPALEIARHIGKVVTWSFVLFGISFVLFSVVRATGAVIVPLFIQALSLLFVRFPLAAMLIDRWQADAIWWSFPISSGVVVVLAMLYYRCSGWRTALQSNSVYAMNTRTVERLRRGD